MSRHKVCPFCGSINLSTGLWSLDSGEVDALECLDCYAGAPLDAWDRRAQPPTEEAIREAFESGYYEGSGNLTWYEDHGDNGELLESSFCYMKREEYLSSVKAKQEAQS